MLGKRQKIRIFLKSGSHIDIKCEVAKFTRNSEGGYDGYDITKPTKSFGINIPEIEAWQVLK